MLFILEAEKPPWFPVIEPLWAYLVILYERYNELLKIYILRTPVHTSRGTSVSWFLIKNTIDQVWIELWIELWIEQRVSYNKAWLVVDFIVSQFSLESALILILIEIKVYWCISVWISLKSQNTEFMEHLSISLKSHHIEFMDVWLIWLS